MNNGSIDIIGGRIDTRNVSREAVAKKLLKKLKVQYRVHEMVRNTLWGIAVITAILLFIGIPIGARYFALQENVAKALFGVVVILEGIIIIGAEVANLELEKLEEDIERVKNLKKTKYWFKEEGSRL